MKNKYHKYNFEFFFNFYLKNNNNMTLNNNLIEF